MPHVGITRSFPVPDPNLPHCAWSALKIQDTHQGEIKMFQNGGLKMLHCGSRQILPCTLVIEPVSVCQEKLSWPRNVSGLMYCDIFGGISPRTGRFSFDSVPVKAVHRSFGT